MINTLQKQGEIIKMLSDELVRYQMSHHAATVELDKIRQLYKIPPDISVYDFLLKHKNDSMDRKVERLLDQETAAISAIISSGLNDGQN